MISELTKEQEKLIPIYQKKWYDKFHSLEFDEEKAKVFVDFLYVDVLKKEKPIKIILDSPLVVELAINLLKLKKGSQLRSQLSSQLCSQLSSQLDSQLRSQLRSQLSSQLDFQLSSQLDSQLDSQLRSQLSSQFKTNFYSFDWWGDTSWYNYLCFYEFVYNELFPEIKIPLFEKYLSLADSNIQALITFEGIAFISKPPVFIKFDENNQLSCKEDYALAYADGFKMAFINGVCLPNDLFEKLRKKDITIKEVLSLENVEQRMVILQEIGFDKLLNELDYKVVNQLKGFSDVLNEEIIDELIEFKLDDFNIRALKYKDYSVGKQGVELVEVNRNNAFKINTVREALIWQCGLPEDFIWAKQT